MTSHANTGSIGVKCKGLAAEVHILKLFLIIPRRILNSKVYIGGVGARGIGEDPSCGFPNIDTKSLGLLQCVFPHKVLFFWFIKFGHHLHCSVKENNNTANFAKFNVKTWKEWYLIDKEVSENTRTIDNNVNSRPSKLFKADNLHFVYPSKVKGVELIFVRRVETVGGMKQFPSWSSSPAFAAASASAVARNLSKEYEIA
ncbi:hypothetical protein RJ639_003317 [Escallonia herrerae]|uniref:Uncharacterized protein n=1 Tax=Escallonia herrerae TaxID=1293975 RepID=A0AA88W8T7_9ASTE|nr:hypothetical protein RJ639_003317 [Escallonia herrerae]